MFATAVDIASKYTFPVIISTRLFNGTVSCGCASFIVINQDGWILTAAHVLQDLVLFQKHEKERAAYEKTHTEIRENPKLSRGQRKNQLSRLQKNNEWITKHSFWWGWDGLQVSSFQIDTLADLAVGKLDPFDPQKVKSYPVFRNPAKPLPPGTSLCRLGFPFHKITATYDEANDSFRIADGVLPIPRFPNDGIHTRIGIATDQSGGRQVKFVETSTPGLRGQSGGPIFDIDGNICALQSRTLHLPLGFSPPAMQGSKEIVEHQFMNVGMGTHVEEIAKFLNLQGVSFSVSTYQSATPLPS